MRCAPGHLLNPGIQTTIRLGPTPPGPLDKDQTQQRAWAKSLDCAAADSEPHTRRGTLAQDFTPEGKQLGGASTPDGCESASPLDESLFGDEAAEILLVKPDPGDCFDGSLQFEEGERRRHQLEDDAAIFHLSAQTCDRRGQYAAMVEHHWIAERRGASDVACASVTAGFLHKSGFVKKFVSLENLFFIPCRPFQAEGDASARPTQA